MNKCISFSDIKPCDHQNRFQSFLKINEFEDNMEIGYI